MPDKNYIRFINSDYKTLFHLPDGGRIRITLSDRQQLDRMYRFINECHTQVGNWTYHICEFAERMEQNGTKYEPLDYIRDMEFYPKYFSPLMKETKARPIVSLMKQRHMVLPSPQRGREGHEILCL